MAPNKTNLTKDKVFASKLDLVEKSVNNLTKSDFDKWYLIHYFFKIIIFINTWYKTYNAGLLAIV